MAAFKNHASYGFWRSAKLDDPDEILRQKGIASFMAEKFTDVSQLPSLEILAEYVQSAVQLNRSGKLKPSNPQLNKKSPAQNIPADLASLLSENPTAEAHFANFTAAQQRDYIEWITEAKREPTRQRRLKTTVEQSQKNKTRNWKYK